MDINELLLSGEYTDGNKITKLQEKGVKVPAWANLQREYDPRLHPVMDTTLYPDKYGRKGSKNEGNVIERVTRITRGWQKLATKRMAELAFGIPAKRICKPEDDSQKKAFECLEAILKKNRINSENISRAKMLYASCEIATIWYTQEAPTEYAGETSQYKLRCKTYSPMNGDKLYPLFDEYDDLVALSVQYARVEGTVSIQYFETFTNQLHMRWVNRKSDWELELQEQMQIGKIAGIYAHRPEPIWEQESENVYEAEWALSRNGNYLRKNARPNWVVFSNEKVTAGKDIFKDNDGVGFLQYPKDASAGYQTWTQAIESLKFHTETIKQNFFMQLQLPDISYENMKSAPMSGESRKMMFTDAQMKVMDESGLWIEFLDREINVIKAFMPFMFPALGKAIEALSVEVELTPFMISDEAETIQNLTNATGGKAIMSQRTAVANLGYVDNIDEELAAIADEGTMDVMQEPTF